MKYKILKSILYLLRSINRKSSNSFSWLFIYFNPFLNRLGVRMKYINNLKDLDAAIQNADEKFKVSDDEGRRALAEFCYVVNEAIPKDPYSKEYYDAQMKLYLNISGKDKYTVDNEHVEFNYEVLKYNPYPYCTKSPTTVGDQLIAHGFLIKTMNLSPHSRILEFGPGWGNTTVHFAQMGYEVTAVDSENDFISLIKHRTQNIPNKVELIHQDMLAFSSPSKFNAVVFFECFHHCADHLGMLKNLERLIDDDGLIAFAAEPIADAPYFPYPWGVRLEGMSVWSIRKFGWLELGFDTSYFMRTLLLFGWNPRRYRSDASPLADVILARKSRQYYEPSEITLPPDEAKTWAPPETNPEGRLRFTRGKSVMTCAKTINAKAVEFCLSNYAPFALDVKLSAGTSSQTFRIPQSSQKCTYTVPLRDWDSKIEIASKTWQPAKVLRNGDKRELGVAVHYFRFVD